jgi:hypothetical protein
VEKAFDDISARLTPVIGLLQPVKVTTTFAKPFMWTPGNTLDFDADMPSEQEKQEKPVEPLENPNGKLSFEETYRELYNAIPDVPGA